MAILWQKKSRYALVTCLNNGQGAIVEKKIAPENVNEGNALWVNRTSIYFRQKLRELGVLLAEPYTFADGGGHAIQCSPYVGPDLEEIFREGKATAELLMELISTVKGVLSQQEREVGIDARLSNFCFGEDGRVYYVDTFPPLVKYEGEGEFIVHFPNPTDPMVVEQELKRKFDPLGILRRLRFSILAQNVLSEKDILVAVKEVMGENFCRDVESFFHTLPDNNVELALAKLTLDDPDAVRELALHFAPKEHGARKWYFSHVFDLSSNFCPLKITAEERIARLRKLFA